MASFNISIDDTLVPGIIATATLEGKTPEAVVNEYAAALANKTCQDLKVGLYYTGPTPPQFNQDGSPYTGVPQDDQTLEEEVIITPLDEEPAPLETEVV
jgi:hypothetical protein